MGAIATLTALIVTPVAIVVDELWIDLTVWFPGVSPVVSNGVLPGLVLAAALVGFYILLKKRFSASTEVGGWHLYPIPNARRQTGAARDCHRYFPTLPSVFSSIGKKRAGGSWLATADGKLLP